MLRRRTGEGAQAFFDAERAQHLDRVRAELQAGANLAELVGALVKLDLAAVPTQRAGGGKPADAGPNHRDARRPCHFVSPIRRQVDAVYAEAVYSAARAIAVQQRGGPCDPNPSARWRPWLSAQSS